MKTRLISFLNRNERLIQNLILIAAGAYMMEAYFLACEAGLINPLVMGPKTLIGL